jgi:hypothetical protein
MTTFEKRSAETTYDDRDSHHERDSRREGDSHQQRTGLPENVMSTWTVAVYDYAEQVLQAQRQFAHSMLAAAAPMLNITRDITSPDANEGRSANNQPDSRSDQRHDSSNRSPKNEHSNDDDTAEYNKRFADNNTSDDNTSDTSRTERGNTQAGESTKTRAPVAASATNRKRPYPRAPLPASATNRKRH